MLNNSTGLVNKMCMVDCKVDKCLSPAPANDSPLFFTKKLRPRVLKGVAGTSETVLQAFLHSSTKELSMLTTSEYIKVSKTHNINEVHSRDYDDDDVTKK